MSFKDISLKEWGRSIGGRSGSAPRPLFNNAFSKSSRGERYSISSSSPNAMAPIPETIPAPIDGAILPIIFSPVATSPKNLLVAISLY
jgi:hypothetical protein